MLGFVGCLLEDLRLHSEAQKESYPDRLGALEEKLDQDGVASALSQLASISQATTPGAGCVLNEMQKAGVSMDMLDGVIGGGSQ